MGIRNFYPQTQRGRLSLIGFINKILVVKLNFWKQFSLLKKLPLNYREFFHFVCEGLNWYQGTTYQKKNGGVARTPPEVDFEPWVYTDTYPGVMEFS